MRKVIESYKWKKKMVQVEVKKVKCATCWVIVREKERNEGRREKGTV